MTAQPYEEERTSLADTCRDLERRGLVVGTAGNIGVRVAQNVAITGTGVDFGRASPNDIVLVHTHSPAATTEAVKNALLLEWASDLYLRAASAGRPRPLTPAQQSDVVHAATRLGYGRRKPAS